MRAENWRQGRKVGHHVYRQVGTEPADGDPWIGSFVDPYDAEMAVAAMKHADRLMTIDREVSELVNHWRTRRWEGPTDPALFELLNKLTARFDEIEGEASRG